MIDGLKEHVFYAIRVYVVNRQGEVVAKTAEFNVGSAADESCAGASGVPKNVITEYISETTISYVWERPRCDDSYGPIEGYEYLVQCQLRVHFSMERVCSSGTWNRADSPSDRRTSRATQ